MRRSKQAAVGHRGDAGESAQTEVVIEVGVRDHDVAHRNLLGHVLRCRQDRCALGGRTAGVDDQGGFSPHHQPDGDAGGLGLGEVDAVGDGGEGTEFERHRANLPVRQGGSTRDAGSSSAVAYAGTRGIGVPARRR